MAMRRREYITLKLKFFTYWKCCGLKITPVLLSTIIITTRCEIVIFDAGKHFRVFFFDSQFQKSLFTYKMRTLSFTRYCRDIIQVRWKTFTDEYGEFTQKNTHRILIGSAGFRLRYDKNNSSTGMFTIFGVIVNLKWYACTKWTSSVKYISCYFSAVSLH